MNQELREVLNKCRNHSTAWTRCENLYRGKLSETAAKPKTIVELGIDKGFSLSCFVLDYPDAHIIGVDNWSMADGEYSKSLSECIEQHCDNFRLLSMTSDDAANLLETEALEVYGGVPPEIDLLHIDADHAYSGVKGDFERWRGFLSKGATVMFHDVNAFPDDVGKFYKEIGGNTVIDKSGPGLGFWYNNG